MGIVLRIVRLSIRIADFAPGEICDVTEILIRMGEKNSNFETVRGRPPLSFAESMNHRAKRAGRLNQSERASVRLSPVRCARASQPFFNVSCARVCVSVRVCVRTTVCTFLFIIIINIIIIIFDRFFSSITRFAVGLNATTFV